ncbi:CU044_5270 family protein [Nonomuraea sp. NPDC059007]|uniref:CU044_5270 family protein n=1 Tax=Nonomuraea sp. NPDC059007 TaxID=3346692 RepID=UPI00367F16F8
MAMLKRYHDAQPEPGGEEVGVARARLRAHGRVRPVRRRRPFLGLATLVALAALVAGISFWPAQERESVHLVPQVVETTLRPVAGAADLAANAAVLAAAESDDVFAPTDWAYMKTDTGELWRRVDDTKFATRYRGGELEVHEGSEFEVGYPFLLSLPTDPDALLARMDQQIVEENAMLNRPEMSEDERHLWAFRLISMGMGETVLPAKLRAAMYGAMARIPGVKYEGGVKDPAGRRAMSLFHGDERVYIHPKTYEYMGFRWPGQKIIVYKAVIVDRAGERS